MSDGVVFEFLVTKVGRRNTRAYTEAEAVVSPPALPFA